VAAARRAIRLRLNKRASRLLLLFTREKIRFNYLLLVAASAAAAVSAVVAVSVDDSRTVVACDTGRSRHENNNKTIRCNNATRRCSKRTDTHDVYS